MRSKSLENTSLDKSLAGLELVINLHLFWWCLQFDVSSSRGENRNVFSQLQISAQVNSIPGSFSLYLFSLTF